MQQFAIVLACLTFLGHGRRFHPSAQFSVAGDSLAQFLFAVQPSARPRTGIRATVHRAVTPVLQQAQNQQMAGTIRQMNEENADSLVAYCEFYGGLRDVRNAVLKDINLEGLVLDAILSDGNKQDIVIPYDGGSLQSMQEMGEVIKMMSRKARDEVFVQAAPGVKEKVGFAPFNGLNKVFADRCSDGNFVALAELYAVDAVLVPQFPGPPPVNSPLFFGNDAIAKFFQFEGPALLRGLTLKPLRLLQKSDTEVTEIGRAWGLPGRTYSRQWQKIDGKWFVKQDNIPVVPPAYATIDMNAVA